MRQLIKKTHMWLALPMGLIMTITCLTGAILVWEREVTQMVRPETTQADEVRSHKADAKSHKADRLPLFRNVFFLHRWLMDRPAQRGDMTAGKMIVGISTAFFALALVSGVWLWWPRTRNALRNGLTLHLDGSCARRLWSLHSVLGVYVAILLLLMAITGLTWSFGWVREAFVWLTGADRQTIYALHTGVWGGVPMRIVYTVAALVGASLPVTGYWLWIRRLRRQK